MIVNFLVEPTRVAVTSLFLIREAGIKNFPNSIIDLPEGKRHFIVHDSKDDIEIYVECCKVKDGKKIYRFVEKLYCNVTFTFESGVFFIEDGKIVFVDEAIQIAIESLKLFNVDIWGDTLLNMHKDEQVLIGGGGAWGTYIYVQCIGTLGFKTFVFKKGEKTSSEFMLE